VTPKFSDIPSDLANALHKRDAQFDALNRLSAVISQSGSLEDALQEVVGQLLALNGADMGSVHVLDPATNSLTLMASRGVSSGFVCAERRIPVGECLCGEAARTGELIRSEDLTADPRLVRPACREERFGSVVSIPLKSNDRTLGVLTIYAKRPGAFSDADQELLVLVGRQIGVAIENARLAARMRDLAVLEERGFIAQEIHDGIAQSLAYLNLQTRQLKESLLTRHPEQVMAELDQIRRVIKDTYEEARELLTDFRTKFREGEGLADALPRHLEEFSRRTAIRTQLINGCDLSQLPRDDQMPLFRIIQEALSNVRKHADAREVTVTLAVAGSMMEVTVCDDGRGFDPAEPADGGTTHLGLEIMRERAAHLGGALRVESQPGRGATLRISIPLGSSAG
jgi:two-component system nitrate/nitrite sensor histidine kinase NarX